jgi:cell division protein FtsQ
VNRPPSRKPVAKPKRPNNVVPLFPKSVKAKPDSKRTSRKVVRKESTRLSIHEKNAKRSIARLKPRMAFGRKVALAITGAVLSLVILVIVAVVSPLLAVREIEVVGANRVSAASILKDLNSLKGKPLPQITSDELAAKLSKYELIDSVSAVALPPSKLRVVVVERTAIAIVNINGIDYLYDAAGVQLGRATSTDLLPTIDHPGNPATSTAFSQAISVILSLPVALLPKIDKITAMSKDNVVLHLRDYSQKILWGDASQPALKAKVLSALLNHYAKHFGQTFDVSAPSQPSVY